MSRFADYSDRFSYPCLSVPLTVLVVLRDAILVAWSMYVRYLTIPEPKSLLKFLDVRLATAEIRPSLVSKVNTGVQLTVISSAILSPVLDVVGHPALTLLFGVAATTTLLSGWGYIRAGGSYRIPRLRRARTRT